MSEEKKVYSIIGKVEIGTDEYRDLIEDCAAARKEADEQRNKWYQQYNKANQLERDLKAETEKLNKLCAFLNSSEEIKAKYKLFLVEQGVQNEV